jgi:flagellar protein FlbD
MIELTRLNGRPMIVNSDLIKTIEASPDTMLTLMNGEKLIVREQIDEVVERAVVHHFGDLERVVALASVDMSGQRADAGKKQQCNDVEQ